MPERYVNIDRQTPMLLPVDLREWVAENDLARLIVEVVEQCDLSQAWTNERGSGSAQYPPGMMLSLVIYAYARGVFSSRRIEQLSYENLSVRYFPITTPSRNFDGRTERYLKPVLAKYWYWHGN
jgi:transposase